MGDVVFCGADSSASNSSGGRQSSVECRRFARWSNNGVWHRVFAELAKDADFEEVFLDSTIVRAHQHAAGAQKNGD